MKKQNQAVTTTLFILIFFSATLVWATALDDYIAAEDNNYTYTLVNTIPGLGYTGYVLNMTSQKWRSSAEVDRTLWQHWVKIVVPSAVSGNTAMLWITGGSNGGSVPTSIDQSMAALALVNHTVVAEVKMVPNQPLYFTDETRSRKEDEIIAYSWDKYLSGGDPNWPAQLPMVKSAVRAMDAVVDFCDGLAPVPDINNFVLAGASKRGWTTWLTAAVDLRVKAVIPIVIDMLNTEKSFRHHHAAYGFWAPAVSDYEEMNIFSRLESDVSNSLMQIVDPYRYRNRFTMPKYLINSAGDDFFLPDSGRFYFDDLIDADPNNANKFIRYVPNTNHSLDGSDAFESAAMFYQAVLTEAQLPKFYWTLPQDGSIRVYTIDPAPAEVKLWQATNPTARDFRLTTIGSAWTSTTLTDQGDGIYTGSVAEPAGGWTAFFVELSYSSGSLYPYKFTTVVRVVPDYLPFACDFNFDGDVDIADLIVFADKWLQSGYSPADLIPAIDGDKTVNILDLSFFAQHWLQTY
jgi:PhoPQ-activated pathogenicity-related protein